MNGFIELNSCERVCIIGGKDPSVSKMIEVVGYLLGMIVRKVRDLWRQGERDRYTLYIS